MSNNYKKVKQILIAILFANLGVALAKIILGIIINSSSILADGYHSIGDCTSNIVGIIGIALANKPKDKKHPYGYNKFEVITGLFTGGMLLFLSGKILGDSLNSLRNPVSPNINTESLIIIIFTLFINIIVSIYEYNQGKKLNSYILISDSIHTKSDIFVSIGVLASLIGIKLGLPPIIDPITSFIVGCFILHAAYEIFKETITVLVDTAAVDPESIIEVLNEFEEIKCYHDIRSRGSKNNIHVDMHIMVDPNMTVEESHKLSHDIEDNIRILTNINTQVIVHIEPYYEEHVLSET